MSSSVHIGTIIVKSKVLQIRKMFKDVARPPSSTGNCSTTTMSDPLKPGVFKLKFSKSANTSLAFVRGPESPGAAGVRCMTVNF
jgi:hypothetical protein